MYIVNRTTLYIVSRTGTLEELMATMPAPLVHPTVANSPSPSRTPARGYTLLCTLFDAVLCTIVGAALCIGRCAHSQEGTWYMVRDCT